MILFVHDLLRPAQAAGGGVVYEHAKGEDKRARQLTSSILDLVFSG